MWGEIKRVEEHKHVGGEVSTVRNSTGQETQLLGQYMARENKRDRTPPRALRDVFAMPWQSEPDYLVLLRNELLFIVTCNNSTVLFKKTIPIFSETD